MKKILILLLLLPFLSIGQVGVNTTTPGAALDVESSNNGVLIPRVQLTSTLDVSTVVNPQGGALQTSTLVYNIAPAGVFPNNVMAGFYYWNGSIWANISGSPNWKLEGNTGISNPTNPATYGSTPIGATENFIGTKDNNDVVLGTNNIERFRVKQTTGNIGIGTANPSKKLDIVAPGNDIGIQLLSGNNSELTYISLGRTNEYAQFGACTTASFFLDALDGDMAIKNFGAGKILLGASVNTNAAMSIIPGGNIGIGTVTPTLSKFQVEGMVGNTTALFRGNSTSNGLAMVADWPGLYFNCYYNGGQRAMASGGFPSIINADQGSGGLTFHTSNIANTVADALLTPNIPERMRIDANGNVGIGVIPNSKLHIANPTAGALQIQDGTEGAGRVLTSDVNGVGTWQNPSGFAWSLNGNAGTDGTALFGSTISAGQHFIGTTDYEDLIFGTNNSPMMKMTALGNIGIGVDNPNAKFQIDDSSDYITTWIRKTNLSGGIGGTSYVSPTLVVNTNSTGGGTSEIYHNAQFSAIGVNGGTNIGGTFSATGAARNYAVIIPANSGDVGIGTSTPTAKLHLVNPSAGALRIEDGTQATGRVFTSDANGVGTWQTPNTNFWSLTGNTVAAGNFIGSTNNADVSFRRNGINAGYLGEYNVAFGLGALQPSVGFYNVAVGVNALANLTLADQNVAVGWNALSNVTTGGNNIGIGTGANVPTAAANNQIRMGNTNIGYAGIQVAWSVTSDSRWKNNIQKSDLGLRFINQLNPVSYVRKNDEFKRTEYGFIAQELEKSLLDFGATNNGIITKDDEGMLSVRYNDLLAPMVKAIQELTVQNENLKLENEALLKRLERIEEKLK